MLHDNNHVKVLNYYLVVRTHVFLTSHRKRDVFVNAITKREYHRYKVYPCAVGRKVARQLAFCWREGGGREATDPCWQRAGCSRD